jgi:zinc protease
MDAPPPFTATLTFRVGRADETLPTSGITHLTEHILMPATPPRELDRNARVEDILAVFWSTGTKAQSLRFIEGLAALISDPPLHRLETERSILRAEAAGGGSHPVSASMALRYGARDHGLIGYDEFGLNTVGPQEVAAWIKSYFTRENAALWLTGEPPPELELILPSGQRRPPPDAVALDEVQLPAFYPAGPDDIVVVSFDTPRSPALALATSVLANRAWQSIRYERGLAYEIGEHLEAITRDLVHETLWVESLSENFETVRDALLSLIQGLADHGATEAELHDEVETLRDELADPSQLAGFLHLMASEYLLGREFSEEDYLRRREEVTSAATASALQKALDRLLVAVPDEERAPAGFHSYPMASATTVDGVAHRPKALPISREARRTSLIVGADGVTWLTSDGSPYTILFDDLMAIMHWADGSRTLIGRDGTRFTIDPADWRKGLGAVAALDASASAELIVPMEPERLRVMECVESVASEKLKRRWVIEDELKLLPEALGAD